MRRWMIVTLCAGAALLFAGCPKGYTHYKAAEKAENIQDYDTALQFYQKALAADPNNAAYRIKLNQIRFANKATSRVPPLNSSAPVRSTLPAPSLLRNSATLSIKSMRRRANKTKKLPARAQAANRSLLPALRSSSRSRTPPSASR